MATVEIEGVVETLSELRETKYKDGKHGHVREVLVVDGMTANFPKRYFVPFWNDRVTELGGIQVGDAVRIAADVKSVHKQGTSRDGKPYDFWEAKLSGFRCENLTPPAGEQPVPQDEADPFDESGAVEWHGKDGPSTEADRKAETETDEEEVPF